MTAELMERRRIIHQRRVRDLVKQHNLPTVGRARQHKLMDLVVKLRGDSITDPDLLVMVRLTLRGMLD